MAGVDPVIRMHAFEPVELTWQEYEQLEREAIAMTIAEGATPATRILRRMLFENRPRYLEVRPFKTASYCQRCIYQTHPTMLSGYCLPDHPCERCGRMSDCALVKL